MLESLQKALRLRALVVFICIHAGLGVALYALAAIVNRAGVDVPTWLACLMGGGIGLLYLGFVLTVFFIIWPLLPWIRRARQVSHWSDRIIQELPRIIEAIRLISAAWGDIKRAQTPPGNAESSPSVDPRSK